MTDDVVGLAGLSGVLYTVVWGPTFAVKPAIHCADGSVVTAMMSCAVYVTGSSTYCNLQLKMREVNPSNEQMLEKQSPPLAAQNSRRAGFIRAVQQLQKV